MQPLVSVIMPVFNAETTVCEAIESVINQTYNNWELLVIDDCSQDQSYCIINNFADANFGKIKIFKTDVNGGPAMARNLGTLNATGIYISFLDSDDIWLPSKLAQQISFIKKNGCLLVYSNYEKIANDGTRSNRIVTLPPSTNHHNLLKTNSIPLLTGLYNVAILGKQYQNTDRCFVAYEDYLMWLVALKSGIIAHNTNEVLALYRVSKKSISSSKFKMLKIRWKIYREVEALSAYSSIYNICNYCVIGFLKFIV